MSRANARAACAARRRRMSGRYAFRCLDSSTFADSPNGVARRNPIPATRHVGMTWPTPRPGDEGSQGVHRNPRLAASGAGTNGATSATGAARSHLAHKRGLCLPGWVSPCHLQRAPHRGQAQVAHGHATDAKFAVGPPASTRGLQASAALRPAAAGEGGARGRAHVKAAAANTLPCIVLAVAAASHASATAARGSRDPRRICPNRRRAAGVCGRPCAVIHPPAVSLSASAPPPCATQSESPSCGTQ